MNIGIIGAGKVGTTLGYVLREKGFNVAAIASRRQASLDAASRYLGADCVYTLDPMELVAQCDVIAVTTQDREIRNVARTIYEGTDCLEGKIIFHTSGAHRALELSPLDTKGAAIGSLHPLQTFPDVDAAIASLHETPIFIEGDEAALSVLHTIAIAMGCEVHRIKGEDKIRYHLAAVFACNLLAALIYSGEAIMGTIDVALKSFYPIIRTTLMNIEKKGPLDSLTGPVARGDGGTVASHLEALKGMDLHESVYRTLSLVAVEMAEKKGVTSPDLLNAVRTLLEKDRA